MISEKTISRVFGIFGTDYRAIWTRSVDENMWPSIIRRWQEGLSAVDEDVILTSALKVFKYFPVSPPTLGQFYELCKKFQRDKKYSTTKIDYKPVSDISNEICYASPEVAEKELKKIREIISKKI